MQISQTSSTEQEVIIARKQWSSWIIATAIIMVAASLCTSLWSNLQARRATSPASAKAAPAPSFTSTHFVRLPSNTQNNAIKVVSVTNKRPDIKLIADGVVEPNRKQVQQVTPLVAGRVEQIFVSTGDRVKKGDLLVVIDSPQVAELHGKLHEAETKLTLARTQLNLVEQGANRVNILKAKASLDEADATLKRDQLLVESGLVARKDLIAAQSEFERANAEYNFQSNVSLSREMSQAKSELTTAQTEVEHLQDGLKALDVPVDAATDGAEHEISKIELRSPISGSVIERFVNQGSGADLFKPLLTVADTSRIWVIANVPENQLSEVYCGMPARARVEGKEYTGKINYIAPQLNEDTRTGRVRIEIDNLNRELPSGAFAQVEFTVKQADPKAKAYIPEESIQELNGKPVVFVKKPDNEFEIRAIQRGPSQCEMVPIYKGLSPGEHIAEGGAQVLKAAVMMQAQNAEVSSND